MIKLIVKNLFSIILSIPLGFFSVLAIRIVLQILGIPIQMCIDTITIPVPNSYNYQFSDSIPCISNPTLNQIVNIVFLVLFIFLVIMYYLLIRRLINRLLNKIP